MRSVCFLKCHLPNWDEDQSEVPPLPQITGWSINPSKCVYTYNFIVLPLIHQLLELWTNRTLSTLRVFYMGSPAESPLKWTARSCEKVVYWGGQSSTWNFWSHVSGCPWWINRRLAILPIPCGLMASQRSKPAAWHFLPGTWRPNGWFLWMVYWCLLLGFPHVLREELCVGASKIK